MSYTPVELRHVRVGRSLFGYNRATVEQLIEEVAHSFEATWRERGELADKVESLEKQIGELRSREHLLTQTLIAAEQAASDVRERARREAEAIVSEAHNEARAIGRAAHSERERLLIESRRIEGMLRGALGIIEEGTSEPSPVPAPAAGPTTVAEPKLDPSEPPAPVAMTPDPVPAVALAPEPQAVAEAQPEPVAEAENEPGPMVAAGAKSYGWTREDTREFDPITPVDGPDDHEPPEEEAERDSGPVLEPIRGAGSRDFDWGE
jgi:hypothetical protein